MEKKSQSQKFKDLAREAECDEDEQKFDNTLMQIAKGPEAKTTTHASDCAVHNAPAYKAGACDCDTD